ncbi:hypothetical protein AMIS_23280 [Actinoplanes missouriensis 431]|uniref:Uncharacterized protein n=1 Tax=Actinoplanes missouriensis (strain ATCC 14538 / DSM 43046 / CBS 188.64 / JCM 3121 / NBRC 102363 / NCIMB 12654 / NRRL B-3342 / UNCC 431) TaxID=512565 RepID=I0H3G1_ACTM4|nr:hypothetical protein [Actinoplanes missouriensis]BAL87548.1 hypothetical protein AMIS_23280 [Actinoplanes missouriensis 431]
MDALLGSLTETELALVRETDPDRIATLDEDALIELHNRVRRARNKYVKAYRRRAADRVGEAGGRGKAHAQNARRRAKAEVFEGLLAAVSQQLAVLARASAEAYEVERLKAEPPPPAPKPRQKPQKAKQKKVAPQRTDKRPNSPDLRKRAASTRATNARQQARKDKRS